MLQRLLFSLLGILITLKTVQSAPGGGNLLWQQHPEMRTGRQTMFFASALPYFNATTTPISYNVTYTSSMASARSAGIGIVGFYTDITVQFSVNISAAFYTTSYARLTMQAYGDTVLFFYYVNWIVIGNSVDFAQIQFQCILCSNLSSGAGTRIDRLTGVTNFVNYNTLAVNVYLSGFWLTNAIGLINYLSASASIPAASTTINYEFTTNQNNTVSQICFTTIIYCEACTFVQYLDFPLVGFQTLTNSTVPTMASPGFPFPASANPDYKKVNRMFFGMSSFSLSRAIPRLFYLQTPTYNNLASNYATNYGTYSVRIDFFWQARRYCNDTTNNPNFEVADLSCDKNCTTNTTYLTNNDYCLGCHYSCFNCTGGLSTNCDYCVSAMFRVASSPAGTCNCVSGYIDIGVALCYPCSTFISGCQTCLSQTICQTCFPGFSLTSTATCQCTSGHLVSGICTNITGCTSLVSYGGITYCTACNSTLNFQTNLNYTCSCTTGYYFNGNNLCSPTCGDSMQTVEEACDDGNILNGDGCSSICTVETNWMCVNGSVTSPSVCYIDMAFSFTVAYVRRVTTANQMQVSFQISPAISQLSLINFKKSIVTDVPCTNYNVSYINGYLIIVFDYNKTIEGDTYDISVTLDPNIFHNTVLSTSIPTSGMNAKLTYDSLNSMNYPMQIVVIVLDCLAILIMFATCISQRMIGIEMIQTIQIVLFTQAVMKTTPSSFAPLQMLRYASGYNEIEGIDHTRTYTFAFSLSSIGLQKQFVLSYNLMYIILAAVVVFCILAKAKQLYHERKVGKFIEESDEIKNEEKWAVTTKVFNFAFERILFLVAFMCMFLVVFALMLQLTDMNSKYTIMSKEFNLLSSIIAIAIIITMICGVILTGFFPTILLFPMLMKQYYPPFYFIYQSAFIFLLAFDYTQQYVLYILQGMSLLFLLFILAYRPYPEKFHTFVLAFHQLLIMGVIGIWIFENLNSSTEHQTMYKIINVVIVFLLYVVVALNTYRLYRYYIFLKQNGWDQYGNPENVYAEEFDFANYKHLQTPKQLKSPRKIHGQGFNTRNPDQKTAKIKKPDLELQEIKRPSKDKKKSKPGVEDDSQIKWNYNQLADSDILDNGLRYQATNRDVKPDTTREDTNGNLKRNKTNQKLNKNGDGSGNKQNENNPDEQFTIKDADAPNRQKNTSITQNPINRTNTNIKDQESNKDQNIFENPYDEKGYPKSSNKKGKVIDEDPLKAVKKKLKQNFESKMKVSTLKQS